jgi:hypothetical protein
VIAVGLVVLAAAAVGGIVLVLAGDDEGDGAAAGTSSAVASVDLPETLERKADGLTVGYPEGWRVSRQRGGGDVLASEDKCTAISLSAPVPADGAGALLRESVDVLRQSFAKVEARTIEQPPIGGVPTEAVLVAVRNKQGNPVVIRVAVSRGEKLAHMTQVILRAPPCEDDAEDTEAILASIKYSR